MILFPVVTLGRKPLFVDGSLGQEAKGSVQSGRSQESKIGEPYSERMDPLD